MLGLNLMYEENMRVPPPPPPGQTHLQHREEEPQNTNSKVFLPLASASVCSKAVFLLLFIQFY